MRYFLRLCLVVLVLGGIFGGIFYSKHLEGQRHAQRQSAPPPAAVAGAAVRTERWQPAIRSVGSLVAVNGIAVTPEVSGVVRSIQFESGKRIDGGEVLLHLEDAVDQAALAGFVADRELARVQFERARELLGRGGTPRSTFDEARFRYESAQAGVREQRSRLAKKVVRAPFTGLLGLRQVDVGQYLTPGEPIVELQALDPIYVDYATPEREFTHLATGQTVVVRVAAWPGREFTGAVSAIGSGIDEGIRSVRVRATLRNAEGALRPGMFAEVRTLRAEVREVLTVPRTAISYNTYGNFVFVISEGEGGTLEVKRRQVTTGDTREGRVEIAGGLTATDRVVGAGALKLRDGQPVTIDTSVELDHAEVSRP